MMTCHKQKHSGHVKFNLFLLIGILLFFLRAHAKFWNPTPTPSGRKGMGAREVQELYLFT